MRISVYVRNKELAPSSYYRIMQYVNKMNDENKYNVYSLIPNKLYEKYLKINRDKKLLYLFYSAIYYIILTCNISYHLFKDCVVNPEYIIIDQVLMPRKCPKILAKLMNKTFSKTKLVWDCDDNVMGTTLPQNELDVILKNSYKIVMTSEYLKNLLPEIYREKVILLPTTDGDMQEIVLEELQRERLNNFQSEIRILWLGTASNIPNLKIAINGLDETAKKLNEKQIKLILNVVCNIPLDVKTDFLKIQNIIWSRKEAINQIYNCHIGIMPLIDDEFMRGKAGFKLVQYISTGMPVIASDVGFNKIVVDDAIGVLVGVENNDIEWLNAVLKLTESKEKYLEYSNNAYKKWLNKFSFENNLNVWKTILNINNKLRDEENENCCWNSNI